LDPGCYKTCSADAGKKEDFRYCRIRPFSGQRHAG
jgi:hypothetical protein